MLKTGIDIGYNQTKALADTQKSVNFPSVVGTDYEIPFTLGENGHGIKFTAPRRAVVGSSAIIFSDLITRREDRNWIASEEITIKMEEQDGRQVIETYPARRRSEAAWREVPVVRVSRLLLILGVVLSKK